MFARLLKGFQRSIRGNPRPASRADGAGAGGAVGGDEDGGEERGGPVSQYRIERDIGIGPYLQDIDDANLDTVRVFGPAPPFALGEVVAFFVGPEAEANAALFVEAVGCKDKVCPVCREIFRPRRTDQEYCKRKCADTAGTRRRRKAAKEAK